jgi:alkanesulfonate monooxygenase SsuD/methylene tetrahydromethanopterin reductase-like flavin-dependent oxidoreductase (luciferase family)
VPGIKLLIGGHGRNYTFRIAARYCDELNINMFPIEVPPLLDAFRERCAEIGRDPATVELNCGTNQIMRYKGLKVTGGQRFAEPHELAYQDPDKVANVGTRAEELQQWRELGFDRLVAGIPGLHNTDEGLYEFIDDCRTAGIDFFDRQADATP